MASMNAFPRSLIAVSMLFCVVVYSEQQPNSDAVAVKWGVADSTAVVGKLFHLHIPVDAFSGPVLYLTVHNTDGSPLPQWLQFDNKTDVLKGIPSPLDIGQLYLDITAHGKNTKAAVTSTIYIKDVPSHASQVPLKFQSSGPEFVWCKPTESETVATVILDVDFDSLSVADRLNLLQKFISHMGLHEDMIKIKPVGDSPLHDISALVSGTGDVVSPKTAGVFVAWPVGCGQVKEGHFPVLQKLDDDSSSGKMSKAVGHPVIAWRVTNSRFQAPARKKRQVQVTATPQLTPTVPTKTDDKMMRTLTDSHSPSYIQPTATYTHGGKTDEPSIVVTPKDKDDKTGKVKPTETTLGLYPATSTEGTPSIKPTKPLEPLKPTDVNPGVVDGCVRGEKPQVKSRFIEYSFNFGEVIDISIHEKTFEDCEVGNTRGLKLKLYKNEDSEIPENFFLQFDSQNQRILGLPLSQDAGIYRFTLVGMKTSSLSASVKITVVINDASEREMNHELSVAIDYDYQKFISSATDKVNFANKVASVYGDADSRYLVITKMEQGSVIYSWTNSSVSTTGCPAKDIKQLVRNLVNEDGTLSKNAIQKLKPFVLMSAEAHPAGGCTNDPEFPTTVSKPRDPSSFDDDDKDSDKNVAKGSTGGDDNSWITIVIAVVAVVLVIIIILVIVYVIHRRKRRGKMNIEERTTFVNKGKPIIFPNELEDKPGDANKPLLVESGHSAPPGYNRGASESPEPQEAGNYRNQYTTFPVDEDNITELPEKPYEPPPAPAVNNGKQPRPALQQQPVTPAPVILP